MSSGTNTDVASLWGNEECMYAVGFDGLVLKLVGDHWQRLTFNSNAELYSICGFGSDNMYFCGSDGTIIHFNGAEFKEMPSQTMEFFLDIWGPSAEFVFAVGDMGISLNSTLDHEADVGQRAGQSIRGVYRR